MPAYLRRIGRPKDRVDSEMIFLFTFDESDGGERNKSYQCLDLCFNRTLQRCVVKCGFTGVSLINPHPPLRDTLSERDPKGEGFRCGVDKPVRNPLDVGQMPRVIHRCPVAMRMRSIRKSYSLLRSSFIVSRTLAPSGALGASRR